MRISSIEHNFILSLGHYLCKVMGTKEIFYIRKESNSHGICLEDQYGHCFFVLEYCDIMWIRSILHENSPLLNNFSRTS